MKPLEPVENFPFNFSISRIEQKIKKYRYEKRACLYMSDLICSSFITAFSARLLVWKHTVRRVRAFTIMYCPISARIQAAKVGENTNTKYFVCSRSVKLLPYRPFWRIFKLYFSNKKLNAVRVYIFRLIISMLTIDICKNTVH